MKKVIFMAIAIVATLASCKKDRVCTCTYSGSSTPSTITYTDAKKGDAQSQCLSATYTGGSRTCELN